ncbi:elongation factor G [Anaerobacillus arseniciselenatis]|uniref:Elongation factor G n=2 Tax=Anaerobacillus arseniciselenatis TaxID=85682 RepID=A0A1S2LPI1_9BACI|nr:elongation factor G [Anaerobacillus arseniciselenatis]
MMRKTKTIGILAHVDAGKTTFAEQILYHTESIQSRGRVDHMDSFLDHHDIEKNRGITIFADQAEFSYNQSNYYLIDTPGHVDFSAEMERSLQVMDYAIVIISAVEGLQGHTETVWELLKKHEIPTFFFINKTDRNGADVYKVVEDIRLQFSNDVVDITDSIHNGEMTEELIEFVAERDEELLDDYIEEGYQKEKWLEALKRLMRENKIFPCASGSALNDIGITDFLEKIDLLTDIDYSDKPPFSGHVFKIRYDESGTRITFIKLLSGHLNVRNEVSYTNDGKQFQEKVTQLRVYNGHKFKAVNDARAGEIVAVTGLIKAGVGTSLGALTKNTAYEMVPALKSKVVFDEKVNVKEVLSRFKMLDEEDPSLRVTWDEQLQEIHIHVMGKIQLEVLEQVVKERFNITITFEKPEIIYKETLVTEVKGYGHFEPLKHYAEVHLKIEPGERNSGITFENECHTDDLSVGYQNLVRHHLFEREHHGLLTGSALTDVKVTLLTGRAHNKHTSGGDFCEATYRALRQGLEKAKNIVLEPYYHFKIKVDVELMGRVIADIQSLYGNFDAPETIGDKAVITGKAPVTTFMEYSTVLASFTHGKGAMMLKFAGYYPCHNEEEVIEHIGYNKDADSDYTSSSIFCAKGAGYSVPWDEAEEKMHAL